MPLDIVCKKNVPSLSIVNNKNRATQRIQFCANPCHNNQRKREVVHDKIGVSEQRFCYPESRAFENRIFQFMKGKHYEVD